MLDLLKVTDDSFIPAAMIKVRIAEIDIMLGRIPNMEEVYD